MEPNKRKSLGEEIKARMDALGLSTIDLAEALAKPPLRVDPAKYYKFVQRVIRGEKPIPKGAAPAWAKALRWDEAKDPEAWEHFRQAVLAARAWGKKDGHAHLASLESALAASEAKCRALEARVRELDSRLLALEASRLF